VKGPGSKGAYPWTLSGGGPLESSGSSDRSSKPGKRHLVPGMAWSRKELQGGRNLKTEKGKSNPPGFVPSEGSLGGRGKEKSRRFINDVDEARPGHAHKIRRRTRTTWRIEEMTTKRSGLRG